MTKLKPVADDKFKVAKMTNFLFGRAENTEGKGEIAGNQQFLPFPQYFQKPSSFGLL